MDTVRTAVCEQAADWLLTLQLEPPDETVRREFLMWLAASPLHVEEFLRISQLSADLGKAAREPAVAAESLLEQLRLSRQEVAWLESPGRSDATPPRQAHWTLPRFAMIGVVLLATAAAAWLLWPARQAAPLVLQSGHGQQLRHVLPDGSVVRLNSDSRVLVSYSARERYVDLQYGEALFEVAHQARPFRVASGAGNLLATGTRFDVYRKADGTQVTLAEGSLLVYPAGWQWPWSGPHAPGGALHLAAGQRTHIDTQGNPAPAQAANIGESLAWLQRQVSFSHWPLGEVAAEFNRYSKMPILFGSDDLRAIQVSGSFDIDDVDAFLAFIARLDGVSVHKTPTGYLVTRRSRPA